jgi:hypothetical protein
LTLHALMALVCGAHWFANMWRILNSESWRDIQDGISDLNNMDLIPLKGTWQRDEFFKFST